LNPYEITFIIRPDLDDEQIRASVDQVNGRIQSNGGEIIATFPWNPARRRMAYPIRDFGDGVYTTTVFNFDPENLREFENALKLNDRILRFLVVQATSQNIKTAQQRMAHAQAQAAAPQQPQPAPQAQPGVPGAPTPAAPAPVGQPAPGQAATPFDPITPAPENVAVEPVAIEPPVQDEAVAVTAAPTEE
jgi:small subunit ribosomal protein S6